MFRSGDTAYIILNNMNVVQVTIVRVNGNLCIVRFESGGGTQLPKSRLYPTREEAEQYIAHKFFSSDKKEQEQSYRHKYNAQFL